MGDNDESVPQESSFTRAFEGIQDQLYSEIYRSLGKVEVENEEDVAQNFNKVSFLEELAALRSGSKQIPAKPKQITKYVGKEEDVRSHPCIKDMVESLKRDVEKAYEEADSAESANNCGCPPCFSVEGLNSNVKRYGEGVTIDCAINLSHKHDLNKSGSAKAGEHPGWERSFESGYCHIADDTWIPPEERPEKEYFMVPDTFRLSGNPRAYCFDQRERTGDPPATFSGPSAFRTPSSGKDNSFKSKKRPAFEDPDRLKLEPKWEDVNGSLVSDPSEAQAVNRSLGSIVKHHEEMWGILTDETFNCLHDHLSKTTRGKYGNWGRRTQEVREDCKKRSSEVIQSIVNTSPNKKIAFSLNARANQTHLMLGYKGKFEITNLLKGEISEKGFSYDNTPADDTINTQVDGDGWTDNDELRYTARNVPLKRRKGEEEQTDTIETIKEKHKEAFSKFIKKTFRDMYTETDDLNKSIARTQWIQGTEKVVEKLNKRISDIIDTRVRSPLSKSQSFQFVLYPDVNPGLQETKCYAYMNVRGMPLTSDGPDEEQVSVDKGEDTYSYAPSISKASDVQTSDTNKAGSAVSEDKSTAPTQGKLSELKTWKSMLGLRSG